MVQWLRLHLKAGDAGSIPTYFNGQKKQNITQKQYCNKFIKDFIKVVHIKKKSLKKTLTLGNMTSPVY